MKGLRVQGHTNGTRGHILEAFDYVRKGLVQCRVEVLPLNQINAALDRLQTGQAAGRLVVDLK